MSQERQDDTKTSEDESPKPIPPPPPLEVDAIVDTPPRWFLEGVAYLSGQISTVDAVSRQAVSALAEQGHAIRQLQAEVFGPSHPPPPFVSTAPPEAQTSPPPPALTAYMASRKPLAKRVTLSENDNASLTRELANLRAEFRAELGQQSRAMGLPKVVSGAEPGTVEKPSAIRKTRAYLFSRAGVKDAISLMTLIAAALGLAGAAMRPSAHPTPGAPAQSVAPALSVAPSPQTR